MNRRAGVFKKSNEYARLIADYSDIPKAVLAAVAVSFAMMVMGEGSDDERMGRASEAVRAEWLALYNAGIVPQRPR